MGKAPARSLLRAAPLLLAMLLGPAAASGADEPATLALASGDPVSLSGILWVDVPRATLHVEDPRAAGELEARHANGTLTLWTWRAASVPLTAEKPPLGEAQRETYVLEDATLLLALRDEPYYMTAATHGEGRVRVGGSSNVQGLPVLLDNPIVREGLPAEPPVSMPPTVPWRWDAGWLYVGSPFEAQAAGFPQWPAPTLALEGATFLAAEGGNLTFPGPDGPVTVRLGRWREEGSPLAAGPGVDVVRRVVFEGSLAATLPSQRYWGVAAPEMTWSLDGTAAWTNATGRATTQAGDATFRDEAVVAEGDLRVVPLQAPRVPSRLHPVHYSAGGEVRSLTLGPRPVVQEQAAFPVAPAAATVSLLALLAVALTETGREAAFRGAALLYTRFTREEVLEHPQRRRLYDLARESPGIHLRELQRRLGCAWGPFSFHLGMLTQAGYLRCEKQGAYRLVFPQGIRPEGPLIPHPVAQRIHEALPEDGSAIGLRELRDRVGISRQLLSYHLRGLSERNLVVTVATTDEGERLVARAGAVPAAVEA